MSLKCEEESARVDLQFPAADTVRVYALVKEIRKAISTSCKLSRCRPADPSLLCLLARLARVLPRHHAVAHILRRDVRVRSELELGVRY